MSDRIARDTGAANLGDAWSLGAEAPDGLRWRLFVPGGDDPVPRARRVGRPVVSVGLLEERGDGIERLVRSAHVGLGDWNNDRVIARLRRWGEQLAGMRADDLDAGVTVVPSPLEVPDEAPFDPLDRALGSLPRVGSTLRAASRGVKRARAVARARSKRIARFDMWHVGVVNAPIQRFLDPLFRPEIEWLEVPRGTAYCADPFGWTEDDGGVRVFVERFDYNSPIGTIASVDWHRARGWGVMRDEIGGHTHRSYPYVLEVDGERYLLPENASQGGITVYRWFRERWVVEGRILPDAPVLDGTVFQHEGRWWLMGTLSGAEGTDVLCAWWADHPLGRWTPHRGNPLAIDPRRSRPGGTPFVHEGRTLRPAQDGGLDYGAGLALCEVVRLTPSAYEERVVRRVGPWDAGEGFAGVHTLSAVGDVTLLDAKQRVPVPSETWRRLRGRR